MILSYLLSCATIELSVRLPFSMAVQELRAKQAARRVGRILPPLCSTPTDLRICEHRGAGEGVWPVDGGGLWGRVGRGGVTGIKARPAGREVGTGCSSVLTRPSWTRRGACSCRRSTVTSSRGEW